MVKVTVYVDDEVWSKFRASVFHRHGSLKGISREVEGSLRSALVEEDLLPYLEKLRTGLSPKTRTRPALKGPPVETHVRRMRRKLRRALRSGPRGVRPRPVKRGGP